MKSKVLSNQWPRVEFRELILGKPRHGIYKPIEFFGKGVQIVKMGTLMNNDFITDEVITDLIEVNEKELKHHQVFEDDLLFLRTSLVMEGTGKCSIIKKLTNPTVFVSNLIAVTLNRKIANPLFYYYYFSSKSGRNNVLSLCEQTAAATIRGSDLEKLTVPFPSLKEQNKIGDVLYSLDEDIKLNLEMNKTLEAIAQAIFKSWFVDFEPFKDELIYNEELDKEIPKGWKVGTLKDVLLTIESGSRPSGGVTNVSFGIPSIGAEHIIGLAKFDYSKVKYVPEEFFQKMKRGKVRNGDVLLYKDGAYIGRKAYFDYNFPFEKCCVNEHVFILRTNNIVTPRYLYFWLDQEWITKLIINISLTSAQPGLNQQSLKTVPILIPKNDIVQQFDNAIEPFIALLFMNAKESRILEQIRDMLLPKLLSGEIRVKVGVEEEFPQGTKKLEEIKEEKSKIQKSILEWR